MSKMHLGRAAVVAAVMAISFAGMAGPSLSQPQFKSRAACVIYCEQKCERVVTMANVSKHAPIEMVASETRLKKFRSVAASVGKKHSRGTL